MLLSMTLENWIRTSSDLLRTAAPRDQASPRRFLVTDDEDDAFSEDDDDVEKLDEFDDEFDDGDDDDDDNFDECVCITAPQCQSVAACASFYLAALVL